MIMMKSLIRTNLVKTDYFMDISRKEETKSSFLFFFSSFLFLAERSVSGFHGKWGITLLTRNVISAVEIQC